MRNLISKHSRIQITLSDKYKNLISSRAKSLEITRSAYIRKLVIKDVKESKTDKKIDSGIFVSLKEFWRKLWTRKK